VSQEIIGPEQAKAVQKLSEFGTKLLEVLEKGGSYGAGVMDTLPHDLVGLLDDWVWHWRIRNRAKFAARTK
jgi:hypothetical protein